jgi:UDPglucose 6-dehydrogenase
MGYVGLVAGTCPAEAGNDRVVIDVEAVDQLNEAQQGDLGRTIIDHFGKHARGRKVAVWGLASRAETDALLGAGCTIRVYDPQVADHVRAIYGDRLVYCPSRYEALCGTDALALVSDWDEFRHPNFRLMGALMRHLAIFDGRNMLDAERASEAGFVYFGIDRPVKEAQPLGIS